MVAYNRNIIYQFADRLYQQAVGVVISCTFIGALSGGALYFINKPTGIALAIVLGLVGFLVGNEIAFWYKLVAQTALCQAKIEENTSMVESSMITTESVTSVQTPLVTEMTKVCPKCNFRHPEELTVCPDCDLDLVYN